MKPRKMIYKTIAAVLLAGCLMTAGGTTAHAATLSQSFDTKQYADTYPDLKAAFGYDANALLAHYFSYGIAEGRSIQGPVDVVKYRALYPDLDAAFGDNWKAYAQHYLDYGMAEGRSSGIDANVTADTTPAAATPVTPDSTADSFQTAVLNLVNQQRAAEGLSALSLDTGATNAAQIRAAEITGYFSHTRPNGTSCFTALDEANVSYRYAGENIAGGFATPEAVVTAWMNSPGHRANIMNANYTKLGVGYYTTDGSYYWVQLFIGN